MKMKPHGKLLQHENNQKLKALVFCQPS